MTVRRGAAAGTHRDWPRLAAVVLAMLGLAWLLVGLASFPGAEGWGYDYRAYHDAAVRFEETGSPYQEETLSGPYRPGPYGLYMYAPPLGLAVVPLTGLSLHDGITFWYLLHVAALAGACLVMPVSTTIRLASFGVAALSLAVTRDLLLGNVSVLLLLPMAMAWRWLDRTLGSVAQAMAIAVRPTLAMVTVWQLLRRQSGAVAWTIGAGLVLVIASLPFVGLDGYVDYLAVLRNLTGVSGVEHNLDLGSTALELGADDTTATVALLAGYAIAIGAMLLSLRRDREVGFMVTATGSLLLAPLLWDHYLAALVLPAAFLAGRGRPWAILLPLATWLPPLTYPFIAIAGTLAPFAARDTAEEGSTAGVSEGLPA